MATLREIVTRAEPDTIRIDGVEYALADPGSFSALESAQLRRRGKVLMDQHEDPTDEQAAAIDAALNEIFALVAPSVPPEVAARLSPLHKTAVIEAFTQRRSQPSEPALERTTDSTPTSLPPSGDSSGSTAAP